MENTVIESFGALNDPRREHKKLYSKEFKNNTTTVTTRYYISSLDSDCKQFAYAVRPYWGIETSVHWCLDIEFRKVEF